MNSSDPTLCLFALPFVDVDCLGATSDGKVTYWKNNGAAFPPGPVLTMVTPGTPDDPWNQANSASINTPSGPMPYPPGWSSSTCTTNGCVNSNGALACYDVDLDGDFDCFVSAIRGHLSVNHTLTPVYPGSVRFFKNKGVSRAAPDFQEVTNNCTTHPVDPNGAIDCNPFLGIDTSLGMIDWVSGATTNIATPEFFDMDGDGDLE